MAATYNDIPPGATAVTAISSTLGGGSVPGNRRRKRVRVTADAAYVTGGYAPPSLNQLGFLVQIDYCDIVNQGPLNGQGNLAWVWNTATQKLQLMVVSTGAELANGNSAANNFCDCVFEGF